MPASKEGKRELVVRHECCFRFAISAFAYKEWPARFVQEDEAADTLAVSGIQRFPLQE